MNKYTPVLSLFVAMLLLAPALPLEAQSNRAALYLDPPTGTYPIGETFVVEVRIDTQGVAVGTADASVVFEPDDLEYVGISDDGSVFDRILTDSDRVAGRVDLSGLIERGRPAFSGRDGLMATLSFIPKRNAATQLRFAHGAATPPLSLTASIGDLSNVLGTLGAASYTLVPKQNAPALSAGVAYAAGPDAFEITPVPVPRDSWFASSSVRLTWSLPEGVTAMRTAVSKDPGTTPDTLYQVPVSSVELEDVPEGEQYFLLQFQYGTEWATPIRYELKVDRTPPSYVVVKEKDRADGTDPRAGFAVDASDALSGVAYYEVGVGGATPERWERPDSGIYYPEGLTPGEHVLTVIAYDRAGNSTTEDTVLLIKALDAPVLTSLPDRVLTGDTITARGTTYPNADVTAYISHDEGEAMQRMIKSDERGEFVVTVSESAKAGTYTVWFSVVDERGAASPNSIKRSVSVSQPYIMLFGGIAVTYLSVIVPLLAMIVLLGLILWLGYTFLRGYRARVRRETGEAYRVVHDEFHALREDLVRQIGMLEKANQQRELTREEMRIFRDLSTRLDRIEEHIQEEVNDITTDVDESELQYGTQASSVRTSDTRTTAQQHAHPKVHTIKIAPR